MKNKPHVAIKPMPLNASSSSSWFKLSSIVSNPPGDVDDLMPTTNSVLWSAGAALLPIVVTTLYSLACVVVLVVAVCAVVEVVVIVVVSTGRKTLQQP